MKESLPKNIRERDGAYLELLKLVETYSETISRQDEVIQSLTLKVAEQDAIITELMH